MRGGRDEGHLLIVVLVVCLAANSFAQTPGAAYVEFGGNGFIYSVNGELPVAPNLTVRVGEWFCPDWPRQEPHR